MQQEPSVLSTVSQLESLTMLWHRTLTGLLALAWLAVAAPAAQPPSTPAAATAADPAARWTEAIARFEAADREATPPAGGVLFVGSSSIRLWDTAQTFPEWPTINRGFGGSQISDVNYYFPRLVAVYRPQVIVFYSGDNDVAAGRSADEVVEAFAKFWGLVRSQLPETHLIVLPIKPSRARWPKWPVMREVNQRIEALLADDARGHYVDTATPLLQGDDAPAAEWFAQDGLHLSPQGYELWTRLVRPVIQDHLSLNR